MLSRYFLIPLFALALLAGTDAQAQNKVTRFKVFVAEGDSAQALGNFYGAHVSYRNALQLKEDADVAWKCAEVCRGYQNYPAAENYYRLVIVQDSAKYPMAKFWYGEMLKHQAKYAEAAKAFKEFYESSAKDKKNFHHQKALHEINVCSALAGNMVDSVKNINIIRIEDKTINTEYSELSIFQSKDSILYFSATRPTKRDTNSYWTQIYSASFTDGGWKNAQPLPKEINAANANVANLSFSKDKKTAFFNKCEYKGEYTCAIYQADHEDGKFTNTKALPAHINRSGYTSTQPRITVIGNSEYLLFASNRPGGKGQLDIWFAQRNDDGSFMQPKSIGGAVNTIGNEITPFYDSRDSILYFSSEMHHSIGGFDIFKSKGDFVTNKWTKPENVGVPVNSPHNDLYYNYGMDSVNAYFTSNRKESIRFVEEAYGNDIYRYDMTDRAKLIALDIVPFNLYFDNDQPNPRTRDTTTTVKYDESVLDYLARKEEYIKEYAHKSPRELREYNEAIMETVFEEEIRLGWEKIYMFAKIMEVIMANGQDIVVTFKGYTSPLATSEYNENLAKRRIVCAKNFFLAYKDSLFLKYLDNEPKSGKGSLRFNEVPIGKVMLDNTLMKDGSIVNMKELEDVHDKRKSVYSPGAILMRKIEILAVNFDEQDELEKQIQLEIETRRWDDNAAQPAQQEGGFGQFGSDDDDEDEEDTDGQ
jgi:tetratricopeptide (TPR) repeat protein